MNMRAQGISGFTRLTMDPIWGVFSEATAALRSTRAYRREHSFYTAHLSPLGKQTIRTPNVFCVFIIVSIPASLLRASITFVVRRVIYSYQKGMPDMSCGITRI